MAHFVIKLSSNYKKIHTILTNNADNLSLAAFEIAQLADESAKITTLLSDSLKADLENGFSVFVIKLDKYKHDPDAACA